MTNPGDRRAVALRQQHDRQLQRLRAEGRERGAGELREALEEELQELPLDVVHMWLYKFMINDYGILIKVKSVQNFHFPIYEVSFTLWLLMIINHITMVYIYNYHLVMTNSLPWKDPPFLRGKPR